MLLSRGELNNLLKADRCLDLVKFNFQICFTNNLYFKGKTAAKFLIRSQFLSIYNNV